MKIFFTSDHHYGDKSILTLCKRPFSSLEEMNGCMTEIWNSTVNKEDMVFHLGDVSFYSARREHQKTVHKLNGTKFLIRGNHDSSRNIFRMNIVHWAKEYIYKDLDTNSTVYLSHKPNYVNTNTDFLFHGHQHGNGTDTNVKIDVGVDNLGFRPLTFSQIRQRMLPI